MKLVKLGSETQNYVDSVIKAYESRQTLEGMLSVSSVTIWTAGKLKKVYDNDYNAGRLPEEYHVDSLTGKFASAHACSGFLLFEHHYAGDTAFKVVGQSDDNAKHILNLTFEHLTRAEQLARDIPNMPNLAFTRQLIQELEDTGVSHGNPNVIIADFSL